MPIPMPPIPIPIPMPYMGRWYPPIIEGCSAVEGLAVRALGFICWNFANSAGEKPAGRSCIEGPIWGACMPGSNSAAHAGDPLCCARSSSRRICSMANGDAGPGPCGNWAFCCMNSFIICEYLVSHCSPLPHRPSVHYGAASLTYTIRATAHLLAAHALVHTAWPSPDQAISLETLVILNMFCELAEWVCAGRALCATEEGHCDESSKNGLGMYAATRRRAK